MESHGVPGEIQVTENVRERLKRSYELTERGTIFVRGKSEMRTFLLKAAIPMSRRSGPRKLRPRIPSRGCPTYAVS